MKRNVFTVPAGVPFLDTLARAVLDGNLPSAHGAAPDPLALPDITLLLPTRRATRAAQDAFLRVSGRSALLMPRIRPISEGEEDQSLLSALGAGITDVADALDLPAAVTPLERTFVLMQLIVRWRDQLSQSDQLAAELNSTPAQAASLAAELSKLMDDVEREGASLDGIRDIVPDAYSEHWQKTVDFLKIVTEIWPQYLAASGAMSPVARQNALILAEAVHIRRMKRDAPVIVAGITGSIPATVSLMQDVAGRAAGAVVLPGLDMTLDDASWAKIVPAHPEHPQYGLKKLLDALGLDRSDVALLPGSAPTAARSQRAAFLSEAMRPADTTDRWHTFAAAADRKAFTAAMSGVSLIAAPNAQDEAEAVALILREAIETPGRTAALVSPDRLLARRVAIRLESWGIRVDDSAGRPFAKTVPGTFLALAIDAVVSDFAPAETMALLKHPLFRAGLKAFDVRKFGRALEIAAFRAPYLGRGLDGIAAALEKSERDRLANERLHPAAERLWEEDRIGARQLVERLAAAYAPLTALYGTDDRHTFRDFAYAHAATAEALAEVPDEEKASADAQNALWQNEAGAVAARFFESVLAADTSDIAVGAGDYADLYKSLLSRENVRERSPVHPRLAIWGPYEARLQQPDVIVLGSLNEGTWPEAVEPGAWLNRPMRQGLGLPAPEEEIGRAAHDFMSLMGAETVVLTRAEKINGVPTVPSRWLMRLTALLDGMDLVSCLTPDTPWLGWARARDRIDAGRRNRIPAPMPCPPLGDRPRKLSVTAIESWISNPYAVFARYILKVAPLPELGAAPDQSLRGALVHDVLARFAAAHPDQLPVDVSRALHAIAAEVLQEYTGHPRIAAFWMPRLERFLDWFTATEIERRAGIRAVVSETSGTLIIDAPGGPFTLTARADRIDDNGDAIILTDYKTGSIPKSAAVKSGRAPQLPLEAAIALGDTGFPGLSGRHVAALRYIRASGGEPAGEELTLPLPDVAELARSVRAGLERLIATFDRPDTPYRALRRPGYRYDYDDYADLARVAEWSAHVDEEAGT